MNAMAIATNPKSFGSSSRAKKMDTIKVLLWLKNLPIKSQENACMVFFLIEFN